ncbi:hypothetical protein CC1G_08757 [Coprinopsis cinerea okayama7|uniref:GPI anchored protein n=1 Tax=Coprinopsis cinerea (strain Okayama-7 / 130 / ATCC MYA-4618 / FGSC 9003) TaxID=240176 RepID=A8NJ19_COPC7|nr:hypothetical protein CC1G_08757 [Coprinopsis cinerea okayama7\|eukprot:XP_001834126.1 hypothetical protein CC1G_08757 [Coprinopsis cinerea okayama7\
MKFTTLTTALLLSLGVAHAQSDVESGSFSILPIDPTDSSITLDDPVPTGESSITLDLPTESSFIPSASSTDVGVSTSPTGSSTPSSTRSRTSSGTSSGASETVSADPLPDEDGAAFTLAPRMNGVAVVVAGIAVALL